MKYFASFVFLLSAFVIYSCTGDLDWTGTSFPCSSTRACTTGFTCQAGKCLKPGTVTEKITPDGGTPEKKHDPDSKFRPPVKAPKVAFLYVGPVGDFGWTWAHEQGRLHLNKLGYKTTSAGPVSVKDSPEQIEKFIASGYDMIVGTSHDFLVPMLSKASKYPDLNFLECSGFETAKNLGSYFGRLYQIEWLAGMIAGSMTKTNRVGLVTTIAIPEIVRHINAFANGVKFTNPKAKVLVKWVGNWFDPKNEPILTKELLDVDVDVVHSHTDTSIPLELIENKTGDPLTTKSGDKVYTIAYNSINGCNFGPRTCLTSVYWNWGPIMERILDQVKKGTWNPSDIIWEQLKSDKNESSFHLSEISPNVPGTARVQIEGFIPQLAKDGIEGQQLPFKGPLKDVNGKERVAAGKLLTDKDLLNMCWLVDNVYEGDGTTPGKVPSECKGDR